MTATGQHLVRVASDAAARSVLLVTLWNVRRSTGTLHLFNVRYYSYAVRS